MMVIYLMATLAAAACGGFVLFRLRVPGGILVGAIAGAAIVNIAADCAVMPSAAKTAAQVMAGAFIGCSIRQDDLGKFRHLAKPALIVLAACL